MVKVKDYLVLFKLPISLGVAFTTMTGAFLYDKSIDAIDIFAIIGVFLLASASSAVNHIQEKKTDALMQRTKNRPLVQNRIRPVVAVFFSVILALVGSFFLLQTTVLSFIMAWIAFLAYNLAYTPLKKKTALAVLPGGITGGLPPVIGWFASGADFPGLEIINFFVFMFVAQVPHFWILLLRYHQDYEKAGFCSPFSKLNDISTKRLMFVWLVATGILGLLFSFIVYNPYYMIYSLLISFAFIFVSLVFLFIRKVKWQKSLFFCLNFYVFLILAGFFVS